MYIVLCVGNIAFRAYRTQSKLALILAIVNFIALFVILFQERKAFRTLPEKHTGRVFFAPDVFFFLSVCVGLIIGAYIKVCGYTHFLPYVLESSVLGGGIFYLLSMLIFGMKKKNHPWPLWSKFLVYGLTALGGWLVLNMYLDIPKSPISKTSVLKDIKIPSPEEIMEIEETDPVAEPVEEVIVEEVAPPVEEPFVEEVSSYDLTFGNYLPELVKTYNLIRGNQVHVFTHVSQGSPLYESFATAHEYGMIGRATHPDQPIYCKHLMVLRGLAEEWNVSYTNATVFDVYRNEAISRGYVSEGCSDQNQRATSDSIVLKNRQV